ncbi:hypothetical protein [Candidatus Pantoea persica]|uniref:hypothetical protein n=1 Tax=Candidatus Pantoea persica TaxID=2518128 RepID=UPI0035A871ED|nr:membrane protein, DUF1109 domain-containing protein [Candidatus Pantoea persica]
MTLLSIDSANRRGRSNASGPPAGAWRAGSPPCCPCGALSSWAFHRRYTDWTQPGALSAMAALLLAFLLGAGTIAAAFTPSIADLTPLRLKRLFLLALGWLC